MTGNQMATMEHFPRGSLARSIAQATKEALAAGVLFPISTSVGYLESTGVEFVVRRILPLKERKSVAGQCVNPFLAPEPSLIVADASHKHLCLLNKFPVFENHLLIVTRAFEDQDTVLNRNDFEALWRCMAEYDALGFYNGGTLAGASQRHKHLQVVPLPLDPQGSDLPIEPLLRPALLANEMSSSDLLPFPHICSPLPSGIVDSPTDAAEITVALYDKMLGKLGLITGDALTGAYNLLVTRAWLFLVPRAREQFESISLNSLAFAGHFLVRSDQELETLSRRGPLNVLQHAVGC